MVIAAKRPMMATTIMISTKVKAADFMCLLFFTLILVIVLSAKHLLT